jgi:hypothetical protein
MVMTKRHGLFRLKPHSIYCCVAFAAASLVVSPLAYAQYPLERKLWTGMVVQGALRGGGFSFDLFGRPPAIEVVVTVVNDSPDTLVFPAAFAANLVVSLQRGDSLVATNTVWQAVDVAVPDEDGTPVGLSAAFNVVPQGVVRISGLLQPTINATFERGDYAVILNVRKSVATVRDGAGRPWLGHFGEELRMPVRIIEPKTPDEKRLASLAAANAAFLKGDVAVAVTHYAEMLRHNSEDSDAQNGIANAYFELDRFKEAASAFETVIARMPRGERSPVYSQAAFAYVALGNERRAEAILTAAYGQENGKRRLLEIRDAFRKR